MKDYERLKNAIDYLQKENLDLRHRHIMQRCHYASPHYLTDMMHGKKPISERFLDRLESEFFISKPWVQTGKGGMLTSHKNMKRTIAASEMDLKKAVMVLIKKQAETAALTTGRSFDDCLKDILSDIL